MSIAKKGFGYEPEEEEMIAIIYVDINDDYQIVGDFDKCLTQVKAQKPFIAYKCDSEMDTEGNASFDTFQILGVIYAASDPEQIILADSSSSGWYWTADDLVRYD